MRLDTASSGIMNATMRRSPLLSTRDRAAFGAIKAYLDRFPDWQTQAAFLSAALLARALSPTERAEHLAKVKGLIAEVAAVQTDFTKKTSQLPRHSRIDDVGFAFQRLLTILRQIER